MKKQNILAAIETWDFSEKIEFETIFHQIQVYARTQCQGLKKMTISHDVPAHYNTISQHDKYG